MPRRNRRDRRWYEPEWDITRIPIKEVTSDPLDIQAIREWQEVENGS